MNATQIDVQYLTPSRTIECFKTPQGLFFIYNYEGYHFRFFEDLSSLIDYFQFGKEPEMSFGSEEELDDFIFDFHKEKFN